MKDKKILKIFNGIVKSIDEEKKRIKVIVSDESKDADGDIILGTAFKKHMKRYKNNPVLLNSHNYSNVQNILGKALSFKSTEEGQLVEFEYFVGKGNPAADWAFELVKQKIAAFSIGFSGKKYEYIEEKIDGVNRITGRKFHEIELLEISQVTVPSNANAVYREKNIKNIEEELLLKAEEAFKNGTLKSIEETDSKEEDKEEGEDVVDNKGIYSSEFLFGDPEQSSLQDKPEEKKVLESVKPVIDGKELTKAIKEIF